jgi:hypothetical protein
VLQAFLEILRAQIAKQGKARLSASGANRTGEKEKRSEKV